MGLFVGLISVALIYFGTKKRDQPMNDAFYQKLAMCGLFGVLCGYFSMSITIRNNPELFLGKPPLSDQQIQNITQNPLPQMQAPKLTNPMIPRAQKPPMITAKDSQEAEARRAEHEARVQEQREEYERRSAQMRAEQEARVQKMKEQRDARLALQQAEREAAQAQQQAAQAAEEARQQEAAGALGAVTVEQLEKERDLRKVELDAAAAAMKAVNARDSGATPQERQAASKRFSEAMKAHMAASKALTEKRRQR